MDGKPLGEKNPKWLNDDYVKFIRFAEWRIEETGYGVLAFISNNGYLDNPTFRGMRHSLIRTFDDIYILNLHGNAKKKEVAPDGSKDDNVFDIQQGVAIGIFVRRRPGPPRSLHHVHQADLWGGRNHKYEWLTRSHAGATTWNRVLPAASDYGFLSGASGLKNEYEKGWRITEAMPTNSLGIATARDHFAVQMDAPAMWQLVTDFLASDPERAREKYELGEDVRDWAVTSAQKDLRDSGPRKESIHSILYRPFDRRYTYYTGRSRGFHCMPRSNVMQHMLAGKNLALSTTRSTEIERGFEHVLCTRELIQLHTVSLKEVNYLFPLYLNPPDSLFDEAHTRANFSQPFLADLEQRTGLKCTHGSGGVEKSFKPEDAFNYMYAVLYSPTYRGRYAGLLKADFPRIPLTSDRKLFRRLSELGGELVSLHLLESPKLAKPNTRFEVEGNCEVGKGFPKYLAPGSPEPGTGKPLSKGRVYINSSSAAMLDGQYFDNVPPDVWDFHIGGYQVCEKWLKDRRGRTLTHDDISHYQKVVTALAETIRLMQGIDAAIPKWPIE